jgi:hypothetical protein
VKTNLPTPATDPDLVITKGAGGGELAAAEVGAPALLPDEPQAAEPPIANKSRRGASILFVFMSPHYRCGLRAVPGHVNSTRSFLVTTGAGVVRFAFHI